MKYRDQKRLVELMVAEWELGERECGATREFCAWVYLLEILEETEQFVYYRDQRGILQGVCGYSKNASQEHRLRKAFYHWWLERLYHSKQLKSPRALARYSDSYDYTPKWLRQTFDGEVSILILDPKYRGRGIGKKLMKQTFRLAKQDGLQTLQILTDTSSNHGFYEKLGCTKVYTTVVRNHEYRHPRHILSERAYVYQKIL